MEINVNKYRKHAIALGLGAMVVAVSIAFGPMAYAQHEMQPASVPSGGMNMMGSEQMKMHEECMAKMGEAMKALDAAKKAADGGDAKTASAEIDKATATLKEMQAKMDEMHKKMMSASTPPAAAAVYTCPMHPQIKESKPGKCPMCGMELIQKK